MRIKHIFLQNFCKFYGSNVVDTDLYDRTEISGARSPESDRTIRTATTLTEILPQKLPWRLKVQTRF